MEARDPTSEQGTSGAPPPGGGRVQSLLPAESGQGSCPIGAPHRGHHNRTPTRRPVVILLREDGVDSASVSRVRNASLTLSRASPVPCAIWLSIPISSRPGRSSPHSHVVAPTSPRTVRGLDVWSSDIAGICDPAATPPNSGSLGAEDIYGWAVPIRLRWHRCRGVAVSASTVLCSASSGGRADSPRSRPPGVREYRRRSGASTNTDSALLVRRPSTPFAPRWGSRIEMPFASMLISSRSSSPRSTNIVSCATASTEARRTAHAKASAHQGAPQADRDGPGRSWSASRSARPGVPLGRSTPRRRCRVPGFLAARLVED